MRLTPNEQETIISYDRSSKFAHVYTANPTEIRKLDASPDIYKVERIEKSGKQVVAKQYKCEKRFITLRKKDTRGKKVKT
jgi:hypothetical protein